MTRNEKASISKKNTEKNFETSKDLKLKTKLRDSWHVTHFMFPEIPDHLQ